LIPDWRVALAEMARVVRPGGVLLVSLGAFDEVGRAIRARFSEITGLSTDPVGLMWGNHDELDGELEGLGLRLRVLPAIPEEAEEPLGSFLDAIEEGRWSWTWHVPEDTRVDAVRELRPWAEERFGPLDRVERYEVETVWRAYDLPGEAEPNPLTSRYPVDTGAEATEHHRDHGPARDLLRGGS
jgi:SAM-dependent methyltransferase